jgi:hypothetical protein
MAEKLSNVIGAPFSNYVLDQLYIRATRNSTSQRSNEEVLFLANKTGWARLISSVNINVGDSANTKPLTEFYKTLGLGSTYTKPEDLAKNWILQGGTSIGTGQGIALRSGIGAEGAYGLGGIEELGYRPMPGLTTVEVETAGRLGSLRQAMINFKVWNMNQLNIVEALYFRLGYSMLLEWGHTQFFNNPTVNTPGGKFEIATNTFGLDDPFAVGTDKATVQQKITKKSKELSGNYDGMLGIVSNFTWSFNQEGGYDCSVKIVGLGSIIDTVRINQSYKMPSGLVKEFKKATQSIEAEIQRKAIAAEEDRLARERQGQGLPPSPPAVPSNPSQIYQYIFKNDRGGNAVTQNEQSFLEVVSYPVSYQPSLTVTNNVFDYFYRAQKGGTSNSVPYVRELNTKYTGLFLNPVPGVRSDWQVVFAENSPPVALSATLLNQAARFFIEAEGVNLQNNLGEDNFVKLYDETIRTSTTPNIASTVNRFLSGDLYVDPNEPVFPVFSTAANILGAGLTRVLANINLVDPVSSGIAFKVSYVTRVKNAQGVEELKTFFLVLNYQPPSAESTGFRPTRQQLIEALQKWFSGSRKISITTIDTTVDEDLLGKIDYGLNPNLKNKRSNIVVQGNLLDIKVGDFIPNISVTFNNTAFIEKVLPPITKSLPAVRATQTPNLGDTSAAENTATATQTDAAPGYESALHVMLAYVKTLSLNQATLAENATKKTIVVDLVSATKAFYQDGVLKNVFNPVPSVEIFRTTPFNLTSYAQKGFNSNLLADALSTPELFGQVGSVDFNKLCRAYLTQYQLSNQTSENIEYPVYISLGYLLAFINNMCLIYDSKQKIGSNNSPQGSDKTPYVYIDFNPDTNFCLTSPQHLSIDPRICLIPFQGSNEDYKEIFPSNVSSAVQGIFLPKQEDELSGQLPEFKTLAGNPYQGKTMNILLNVDFLMKVANSFTASSPDHAVNLQPFLEAILTEVNKSLGNLNLFRVAYRDDSNTVQIKDDQWVPGAAGEVSILNRNTPVNATSKLRLGELPVFGLQSLVRSFQFRTNVSTKLGSMVAISAQAATGSINATDPSSFSYLNATYQDRFKPYITEGSGDPVSGNAATKAVEKKSTDQTNNDLVVAEQFNALVESIYSNFDLDFDKVDAAKNYYIECISKSKSEDSVTSAAPFIPADLEITIDGIAGILIGNAFTIPEDRLPLSLRGEPGRPKVGFIVAGLSHSIVNNQWLTKIRGQMIKLRDVSTVSVVTEVNKRQNALKKKLDTDQGRFVIGDGYPVSQSDIAFANQYTGGVLPAVQLADGTFQIARIEGSRYWLQPNPTYLSRLVNVTIPTNTGDVTVRVSPAFATRLVPAFTEVRQQGLQRYIVDVAGGLAVRNVTNGTALSFHAWGFAIDINASVYGYDVSWNSLPQNDFNRGFERVALILNKYGVSWFKSKDPMHFSIYESNNLQF